MLSNILKPRELHVPFFDNNPLPCLLLRADTLTIITANAAAAAFFHTTIADLETSCFCNLIEATDAHGLLKKLEKNQQPELRFNTGTESTTARVFASRFTTGEALLSVLLVADRTGKMAIENESLLAAMVNETSDVLTAADLNFKPITWSKAAEQLYGITREQALGKSLRAYTDIQYTNSSTEDVRHQTRIQGFWRGEMLFVRPTDGKKLTLLITFKLITDSAGEPQHYVISGTDISEQKETEARLRETEKKLLQSETFYRTLISDSVTVVLLTTADGTITYASPPAHTLLGYDLETVPGRNVFTFVHPDDQGLAFSAFLNELSQTPEVKSVEVRVLKADGTWLWCSVRGNNLLANPNVGRMVISLQDDTQRKQATDALRESEQRFRALIKDLKLGVTLQNAAGDLLMYNKATADLFGMEESALEGANLYGLFKKAVHEDETPFAREDWPMQHAARTKKPVKGVIGICGSNAGERTWLLMHTNPVLDEAGNIRHIISSFTDLTERKKLSRRLLDARLNQQRLLTQATIDGQERERKEIGKELHDNIGQQLATAKLYLDLVKASIAPDAAELLARTTKCIADIINEVRTISHSLVPPTLGDLGLVESVYELVSPLRLVQQVQICFQHEDFAETGLPENGKLMLYRIIQEALNNISKHAQATAVQISLQRNAGMVLLQIKDNGQGFDREKTRKGLGLHNIRNRAELFGGTISIQSAPGAGCTVQVAIPDTFHLQESVPEP